MAATTKTRTKKPETEEERAARLAKQKRDRQEFLASIPKPPHPLEDLAYFDIIIINSSAGKDSQAMLDYVVELARKAGVLHRLVVIHCDLGKEEWDETVPLAPDWKGTVDLARRQARSYGLRFEVRFRKNKDTGQREGLLMQILKRRMWPSAKARYCTSDQKRAVVRKFITELVAELGLGRPARVLNVKGMRGQESCTRENMAPFEIDDGATSGRRHVWTWLPIKDWKITQVWERILRTDVPYHPIYDHGISRASCSLCILASKCDLMRSIQLRDAAAVADANVPNLVDEYIAVERKIGHTFRDGQSIEDLARQARGDEPSQLGMFAVDPLGVPA